MAYPLDRPAELRRTTTDVTLPARGRHVTVTLWSRYDHGTITPRQAATSPWGNRKVAVPRDRRDLLAVTSLRHVTDVTLLRYSPVAVTLPSGDRHVTCLSRHRRTAVTPRLRDGTRQCHVTGCMPRDCRVRVA